MKLDNNVSIDWLSFTLPYTDESMKKATSLGDGFDVEDVDYGRFKYTAGVKILDGGNVYFNSNRKEMGIHVALNSASLAIIDLRPLQLVNLIRDWGGVVKRLDLAFDDYEGLLDTDEMYRKILAGEVTTRYRTVSRISNGKVGIAEKMGDTINIGRRSSESFIRIYDKAAEQLMKGKELSAGVESWVRVELETKGDKAEAVARLLGGTAFASERTAGQEAANLLYGLLDFKVPSEGDENKTRWETAEWWVEFVRATEKKKLSMPKKEKSIEKSKVWVKNQVGAVLAMIILSKDDDNGESGWDFVVGCIVAGEEKMSKNQKKMLDLYNEQQEMKFPDI